MAFGIDLKDEELHPPESTPTWRESLLLEAFDEDQKIGLFIYMHARPGEGRGDVVARVVEGHEEMGQISAWDVSYSDEHVGKELSINGVSFNVTDPGRSALVTGGNDHLHLHLQFDGFGPIYDYDWQSWMNSRHYEQFGRVQGRIKLGEREIDFAGTGTRDHAWGSRGTAGQRAWIWMTARFPGPKAWGILISETEGSDLFAYALDKDEAAELRHATVRLTWRQGDLEMAVVEGQVGDDRIDCEIRPIVRIDLSGTDQTKKGTYLWYFVEIKDVQRGSGFGLLDVSDVSGLPLSFEARIDEGRGARSPGAVRC